MWQARQYLESLGHEDNAFVTLTYSPENLPPDGSVHVRDLQLFLKRLRETVSRKGDGHTFRFYAVGEYGDLSWRPHYHLSLFGLSGNTILANQRAEAIIERSWGLGHVLTAEFNQQTAAYVAGYLTKRMTKLEDKRLNGRNPEFATMSRRPGIGFFAMRTLAMSLVQSEHGMALLEKGDVPHEVRLGKKKIPLNRYLRNKLREAVGFTDDYIAKLKEQAGYESSEELLLLFKAALDNEEALTPQDALLQANEGRIRSMEARAKIRMGRPL